MRPAAIELNDAGLAVVANREIVGVSPGYVLPGREPPLVGDAARALARIEPLAVIHTFWSELSQEPLRTRSAEGRSTADLAFLHLAQLRDMLGDRADAVVIAVPASMNESQLALTMGVTAAAGLPLLGFADAAAAAASISGARGHVIHVDMLLHQAVVTAVEVGEVARRGRYEVVPKAGIATLQEAWLGLIGRRFISDTRFDPLHDANNEQALFDALPGWLTRLAGDERMDVEMNMGDDTHRISVSREELGLEAQAVLDNLVARVRRLRRAGQSSTILLSDRVAHLPGIAERLAEFYECEILACAPGAAAFAAAEHAPLWEGGGGDSTGAATILRSLPVLDPSLVGAFAPMPVAQARPAAPAPPPTHVLYRGQAHALRAQPLVVGLDPGHGPDRLQVFGARAGISRIHCSLQRSPDGAVVIDHSRYGTWLNDESVAGRAPLHAGDRLRLGSPGIMLELIAL
jgi:hypothetical protein